MFLFRGVESHPRSFVKAVTWRALGSIDTFVLSWIYTGSTSYAGAIAGTEVFTKIFLFYFHERIWSLIRWGHLTPADADADAGAAQTAPKRAGQRDDVRPLAPENDVSLSHP